MIEIVHADHIEAIVELNTLCGFPSRSVEGWKWALFGNPEQGDEPVGYVAVKQDRVIGFAGTQRRILSRGEETMRLNVGHTLLTHLKSPGCGIKLARHALKHGGADITATLNNNELSAPLYPRIGMPAWLGDAGRHYAECRIDTSSILSAALRRRLYQNDTREKFEQRPEFFHASAKTLVPDFDILGFEWMDPFNDQHAELLDRFSSDMQAGTLFQTDRSAKVWRYRMSDPDYPNTSRLLATLARGRIEAMMCVSISKEHKFNPPILEIEDFAIRPDLVIDPHALLDVAAEIAKRSGLAKARLRYTRGLTEPGMEERRGWVLRHKDFSCCHGFESRPGLLQDWAVGPMDGDFFFALRRPPQSAHVNRMSA